MAPKRIVARGPGTGVADAWGPLRMDCRDAATRGAMPGLESCGVADLFEGRPATRVGEGGEPGQELAAAFPAFTGSVGRKKPSGQGGCAAED